MSPDVPAESSPAPESPTLSPIEQAVVNNDMAAFKEARRNPTPKSAESAPASAAEQPASTDATLQPASEPGKAKDKGVKARNAELDTEIQALQDRLKLRKALREELEQTKPPTVPAESSPAPASPSKREYERYKAMPDAPKLADFEDYGDFTIAMSDFIAEKKVDQKLQQFETKQQQRQQTDAFSKSTDAMLDQGRKAHEDFDAVLGAAEAAGVQWPPHVVRMVLTRKDGHDIAYALAQAKDDAGLVAQLADPAEAGFVIATLLGKTAPPPAPPPSPVISRAPAPPQTVGRKPADPVDAKAAALASDDVRAFREARLAERRAALR